MDTLQYFTEKGADDAINKYTDLIGNEYYFSSTIEKQKLESIQKRPATEKGFTVRFLSNKNDCDIYVFMQKNKEIIYSFQDYEYFTISNNQPLPQSSF